MTSHSDLANQIIAFAGDLQRNSDAASDLWTWLPSYKKAQACLGDYAFNVKPPEADIMYEACEYIRRLKDSLRKGGEFTEPDGECPCQGECPKFNVPGSSGPSELEWPN